MTPSGRIRSRRAPWRGPTDDLRDGPEGGADPADPPTAAAGYPQIRDHEFRAIAAIMAERAGMALPPHKRELVIARLSGRLRELGLRSFGDYCERVHSDPSELARMVDRITTHETRFFRETRHFEILEQRLYPRWKVRSHKHLRFMSAGCSTGEEPFSLAMSARHHFPSAEGWTIEVVALDVSPGTVAQARDATWPIDKAKDIPERFRKAFMLRGVGPRISVMRASRELRALVSFHVATLSDDSTRGLGGFDVIFCCNVLMYFPTDTRERATDRLIDRLNPGGCLFLGHAESLTRLDARTHCIGPNAYVRSSAGDAP